jgi:hypothetical protein
MIAVGARKHSTFPRSHRVGVTVAPGIPPIAAAVSRLSAYWPDARPVPSRWSSYFNVRSGDDGRLWLCTQRAGMPGRGGKVKARLRLRSLTTSAFRCAS